MNSGDSPRFGDTPRPPVDTGAGEHHERDGSLDSALDDLERALGSDGGAERSEDTAADDPRAPSIPLLDEVVVPGHTTVDDTPPEHRDGARQRVAERLADEIEVIVQTCLEQEMTRVRQQLRERIREHIAITLPELLDALEDD